MWHEERFVITALAERGLIWRWEGTLESYFLTDGTPRSCKLSTCFRVCSATAWCDVHTVPASCTASRERAAIGGE